MPMVAHFLGTKYLVHSPSHTQNASTLSTGELTAKPRTSEGRLESLHGVHMGLLIVRFMS